MGRNGARVRQAAWLSDDVLLVTLALEDVQHAATAQLVRDRKQVPLEARMHVYAEDGGTTEALMTARLDGLSDADAGLGRLVLDVGGKKIESEPAELSEALCDLRTLALGGLAGLGSSARAGAVEFLAGAIGEHAGTANPGRLERSLFVVREAVRERLPASVMSQSEPWALGVEAVLRVDRQGFYVQGWMRGAEAATRLTAVAPEGFRVELLDRVVCYRRADIEHFYGSTGSESVTKHGFVAYFELEGWSSLPAGWVFELGTEGKDGVEARAPETVRDPGQVRDTILADLERVSGEDEFLLDHVFPAVSRIEERVLGGAAVERVLQLGMPPEAPDVSIVIPLYRRLDFLEHQLAQLAHDPEVGAADLVYVLDSPGLAGEAEGFARSLHELYRVPFRLATLTKHAGYAGANNLGASLAEGRLLVLLNSDVFPDRPGWLGAMASFYDATPGIGALGAKLLYEDDSLQHAGMYFVREPGSALWENVHCYKGLHRRLAAANVARPVPAVTGACLMIDRELYRRLGGLRGAYAGGDNEDSDLCLGLLRAGFQNWYLPDAELYHLEGQSLVEGIRKLTRRYNDWLQTRLWNDQIESLSGSEAGEEAHAPMVARSHE